VGEEIAESNQDKACEQDCFGERHAKAIAQDGRRNQAQSKRTPNLRSSQPIGSYIDSCISLIYYAPMDKPSTVSKTYRVTMTADEHRAVRVYCANHDTKASELIAKFLKRLIAKENNSLVAVAEMHESENT
jgi:hypothetical protein